MSLPVGRWQLNVNGHNGVLNIVGVSNTGEVTGTVTVPSFPPANLSQSAFWNEAAQELKFIVNNHPGNPSTSQFYVGYLFSLDKTQSKSALAGYLTALEVAGGSANRSNFGWFATL
jgi:hypothetical protein